MSDLARLLTVPRYGVFTPYTLGFHRTATAEPASAFLKRAAVLFERLLFVPEGLGPLMDQGNPRGRTWYLDLLLDGSSDETLGKFRKLFVLDYEAWGDSAAFIESVQDSHRNDLWHGGHSAAFIEWVRRKVEDETRRGTVPDSPAECLERQKHYLGALSYDYKLLAAVSEKSTDFAGLFTATHEEASLASFGTRPASPDAVAKSLSNITMADLGLLSWDHIFVLRESGFALDFRRKVAEWLHEYPLASSVAGFEASLDRLLKDAMFELIDKTEPNIPQMVMSAVVGAVPGLGALASAKTLIDMSAELERRREYGWLYFVQKGRSLRTDP